MRPQFPKSIRLPFGFVVRVVRLPRDAFRLATEWEEGEQELDGCWSYEDMAIYLDASVPVTRQRYMLCHEVAHAALDLAHHVLNSRMGRV